MTQLRFIFLVSTFLLLTSNLSWAEDNGHFQDRRPFEAAQRVLDTVSPLAPLVPEVGAGVVRLQNMLDLAQGRIPPRWRDPDSITGHVLGGKWMINFCADTYIPPKVSPQGTISLYASPSAQEPIEFSFGGKTEAVSGKYGGWTKGTLAQDTKGQPLSRLSITLDSGRFTLVTLRSKDRKGEPCTTTVKVFRNGNTLELSRIADATYSLDAMTQKNKAKAVNMDPYGFGVWLNEYRRKNGLGPLAYDPNLDRFAARNNTEQLSRNTVGHFDNKTPYGMPTLQNASRRASAYATLYGDGLFDAEGWVHSPLHNAALLDPTVTRYGIAGVSAAGPNYGRPQSDAYWTLELTSKSGDRRNLDGSLLLAE